MVRIIYYEAEERGTFRCRCTVKLKVESNLASV